MSEIKPHACRYAVYVLSLTSAIIISLFHSYLYRRSQFKDNTGDYVVLIHGLGRTSTSMEKMEIFFLKRNFRTVNIDYPSTNITVEEAAGMVAEVVNVQCSDKKVRIHFVTHSLGGIVVRCFLKNHPLVNMGRVVMLSPPSQGSEIIDFLSGFKLNVYIFGPVLFQISTGKNSIPYILGKPDYDVGIITGDRSYEPLNSFIIPGPDDGKVSVERAKLDGMKDYMVVHRVHTFIMNSPEVMENTLHFVNYGYFKNKN